MAWNTSNNGVFFERLKNWAKSYQGIRDEGQRLNDLWVAEGVSSSGDFTEVDGITPAEATDLIVMLVAVKDFTENEVVSQGDRVPTLTPFLVD